MFDDYYCSRCGAGHKWEQMTSTPEGNIFCPACWSSLNVDREPKRKCPVDDTEMLKEIVVGLVLLDKCPACGGTWLDKDELDVIKKHSEKEAWNSGFVMRLTLS